MDSIDFSEHKEIKNPLFIETIELPRTFWAKFWLFVYCKYRLSLGDGITIDDLL